MGVRQVRGWGRQRPQVGESGFLVFLFFLFPALCLPCLLLLFCLIFRAYILEAAHMLPFGNVYFFFLTLFVCFDIL